MFSLDEMVGPLWPLHPEPNPFHPGPLKSCNCGKTGGWQSDLEQASSSCLFFWTGAGHQGLGLEPMQKYPEMLFKWMQESFSKQESIESNGRKPLWVSISMEAAFTSSNVNCVVCCEVYCIMKWQLKRRAFQNPAYSDWFLWNANLSFKAGE